MAFQIQRFNDSRVVKCVLHRVGDIPGGVTVAVSDLGGSAVLEGTPLAKGSDGLYHVVKTALIITAAAEDATVYEVAKGSNFKAGDYFAAADCSGQVITTVDTSDSAKDTITVGTTLGAAIEAGTCAFEADGNSKNLKYTPTAIAGSNYNVPLNSGNLFIDAWVIAVVNSASCPAVNDTIQNALKGVVYVEC